MKDLSIVIVSYNTKKLLASCLESLVDQTREISYEVIVVDNGSTDGTVEELKKQKKENKNLTAIFNKQNVGFAKANNQGIKRAEGRFILLLNSDTKFTKNTLLSMVLFMEKKEKAGVATCKLVNPDGTLQPTGGNFPDLLRVLLWATLLDDIPGISLILGSYHPHAFGLWYKGERQVDWVTGAFLLARKEVFDKQGGLDEDFFMYGEDVEFCLRTKKAGWQVWHNPKTSIVHLGGASSETRAPAILGEFRGLKKLYQKHYPAWQLGVLRLFLALGALVRIPLFAIISRQKAKIYVEALAEV